MTNFNFIRVAVFFTALILTCSFTSIFMPNPPIADDITVCEGEPTIVVPMADGTATEVTLAVQDFDGSQPALPFMASVEFNDGTNDYFEATDGSTISIQSGGMYSFEDGVNMFWAAEDVDDDGGNGASEQSLTFDPVNIDGFSNVSFCFAIAAGNENPPNTNPGYDAGDYVTVEYSVDGGAFQSALCYAYLDGGDDFNEPFHSDPNCDGDGADGVQLTNVAQNFEFELPAAASAGSSVVFRILVAMSSASEEIAFDDIAVKAVPSGDLVFNYYDMDPSNDTTLVPVATDVPSYDAGVTLATSPDTIWVTAEDATGESLPTPVVITVLPNTEAGPNQFGCDVSAFDLTAVGDDNLSGTWSGGLGSFTDPTSAMTSYIPSMDEYGVPVVLTYTLPGALCGESDELIVYNVVTPDPSFVYPFDSICPGDGIVAPIFTGGEAGIFEVISGNENDLDLDPETGEINLANSLLGTYTIQNTTSACGNLILTGVIDGGLSGGLPKAFELLAVNDIPDLSIYGIGAANNGGGTDGEEFTFPAEMASKGDYIYVASESVAFTSFFGFAPDYISTSTLINGDDAVELYCNGVVIDLFGDVDVNGDFEPWDYTDGWAYRTSGNSLNLGSFEDVKWTYSGRDALDNETDNATAQIPFPLGTFSTDFMGICPNEVAQVEFVITDFGGTMLMCPEDVVISLDGGECGIVAVIADASAIDNCSPGLVLEQVSGPVSGDFLDQDNSPYIVTFEGTTDAGELVSCSYSITIEDYTPQSNTLACNGAINLSLNELCEGLVTADMLLEGNDYFCYDEYILSAQYNGNAVGTVVPNSFGNGNSLQFDNSLINIPIEVLVSDPITGNTCWGYVTLEDKLAPVIICPDLIVVDCDADLTPMEPEVEGGCDIVTFVMEEDINDGDCADSFYQEITRTWVAIDNAGNQSDPCIEIIQIERDVFSEIVFPSNYDGAVGNNPVLPCNGEGTIFALDADGNPNPESSGNLIGTGQPVLGSGCSNLIIYYNDNVINTCGNTYKVIRDWTAIDWCSGELAESTQVIKVGDTEGPTFIIPDDVTMSVDNHCRGDYILPSVETEDNCGTATVSFSADEGIINGDFFEIDQPEIDAAYTIYITATDECGNETTESFTVTFVDLVPPVVNAESTLTVSLGLDGTAKVFAESFDDGSYDSCSDIEFAVIRNFSLCDGIDYDEPAGDDNFQFNDVVHFCCSDIGEAQMVTFRVCDDADGNGVFGTGDDNCNTAMVEVIVQNKQAPVLVCPPATTINCFDASILDLTNLNMLNNLFGEPQLMNACDGQEITQSISQEMCGEGIIIRQFIALGGGQSAACSQIITILPEDENKLSCDRISFAELNNSVYNWCAVNDNLNNSNDDLPALEVDCDESFAIPALDIDITGLCTEVGENISVDTFNFAGGACKKYLVHYEVIDQCVFDENFVDPVTDEVDPYNADNGYYEFYLEIDAFDDEAPSSDAENVTVSAEDCTSSSINIALTAMDNCTNSSLISIGYKIDLFGDDELDITDNGDFIYSTSIVSGSNGVQDLPVGQHTVYQIMSDGCGNTGTSSFKIIVEENEKEPTPYCKTGFVASISAMGMVNVTAEDFDAGSFDNCTAQEDLVFSFSPDDLNDNERMFTCEDLGFQFLQIYVTDEDGNQDFCNVTFLVQDNLNICNASTLSGQVQSLNGFANKDAMVLVEDSENINYQLTTDENGLYELVDNSFSDFATVTIEDYNSSSYGITALDILFIRKHILGIQPLETNAKWIAADVDNNQKINGIDIIQIRKLLLGHISAFEQHMSWVAFPSSFDIELADNPYEYPKEILLSDATSYDFTTIKVGDVNGSHQDGFHQNNSVNTRSSFEIEYESRVENGKLVYDLYADLTELVGLDWKIKNSNFEISSSILDLGAENTNVNQEEQRLIWTEIHPYSGIQLFASITNVEEFNEIVNNSEHLIALVGKDQSSTELSIQFRNRVNTVNKSSFEVYPNPFSNETTLEVYNIDTDEFLVQVFSVEGKNVYSKTYTDQQIITLKDSDIPNEGMYTVRISNGKDLLYKKIMKIK